MKRTAIFGGGLAATFFGGGGVSSSGSGFAAAGAFFLGAAAGGAAGFGSGGAAPPALHFTVAFSKASFTLALRISANPSRTAVIGRSPTIFINVPMHTAPSIRTPSTLSSRSVARVSESGFTCGGWIGVVARERHLPRNFRVPSLTWGFLDASAGPRSGIMSGNVVCNIGSQHLAITSRS